MININKGLPQKQLIDGEVYFNQDDEQFYMWFNNKSYKIPQEVIELKELINSKNLLRKKKQYYKDTNDIICLYTLKGHSCSCGSDTYYYEYDGNDIFGICNDCEKTLYKVKDEYIKDKLEEGIWK